MKIIPSSRRHRYVTRAGMFLVTVALIAGVVGCGQPEYTPMVATGYYHTVGLKDDGTVVAVGHNNYGQCNVGG